VQRVGDNRLLTGRDSFVDDISRPARIPENFRWAIDLADECAEFIA